MPPDLHYLYYLPVLPLLYCRFAMRVSTRRSLALAVLFLCVDVPNLTPVTFLSLAGCLANTVVTAANSGRMPVHGREGCWDRTHIGWQNARFTVLADRFHIGSAMILSLGDLLIFGALAFAAARTLGGVI